MSGVLTLVCFAVREEAMPFRRTLPAGTEVLITGMGAANARDALLARLSFSTPRQLLTCGFAGALQPGIACGTVVFDADPGLALEPLLVRAGARPVRFHCSPRVVVSARAKARLREETGADAVEMESAHLREICHGRGIPSATVRVISDGSGEDLPLDFNALLTDRQRLHPVRLLVSILRDPGVVPRLLRLRRTCVMAAGRLAEVLERILKAEEMPGVDTGASK